MRVNSVIGPNPIMARIPAPKHKQSSSMDTLKIPLPFPDRVQAAEALAVALHQYHGCKPLILAIPRGALPIGEIIAKRLQGELDVVLTRKISAPFSPELAIGAIDETGWLYLTPHAASAGASEAYIRQEAARQLTLLKRRRAQYTPLRPPINPAGRVVIVIDDGIATGATMIAALHAARAKHPAALVCATPVVAADCIATIAPLTDAMVYVHAPEYFRSVSQFYRSFLQVDDDDVIKILRRTGAPQSVAESGV